MKFCGNLLVLLLGLCGGFAQAAEETVLPSNLYGVSPEASMVYYEISCFDEVTSALLDCPFSVEITGLAPPKNNADDNDGHSHGDPDATHKRPLGSLSYGVAKKVSRVSGSTNKSVVEVLQQADEVSGRIAVTLTVDMPPNYVCVGGLDWPCITSTRAQALDTLLVKVPGLVSLYGSSGGAAITKADGTVAPYIKLRSPDVKHLDANAFYGFQRTLETLEEIANEFKANTKRPLSINDMSLPLGGKFDVNGSWGGAHGEHRLGISADINKVVPCNKDMNLQKAVDAVIPIATPRYVNMKVVGRTASRLLCESWNSQNEHIDFDL